MFYYHSSTGCDSFQLFLDFDNFVPFWGTEQVFHRRYLSWNLSDFFSQLHWGYDVCEKTIEIKCFSYYIIADVKIDYLARVMFIRLPLYKITPFLSTFHTIFFSKKSYVQPTMRSRKLYSTPLREEYPFKLFGSLLHKRFIYHLLFTYLLIYLFIYLIIYIDRGLWNLFYTWVTIQYYLIYFVAQIVSVWAIENSVSWLLCLWHLVHIYIIPL